MGFQRQLSVVGGMAAGLLVGSVVGIVLSVAINVMSIWLYSAMVISGAIVGGLLGYRYL